MKAKIRTIGGQASWMLRSSEVEAWVTELGGQLAPVTFDRRWRRIQPFSIAPWVDEPESRKLPPILRVLRGDFFCLPFGGNATPFRGERHPIHGETANGRWHLEALGGGGGAASLHLSLTTRIRRGRVDKWIELRDGQNAVYCRHTISGMSGPMCFGHHAMLRFPDRPGSGVVTTSAFAHGQVFIEPTEQPENRGYSWLQPGATFDTLERVPTLVGKDTDLARFPARRGFEDIAMILSQPDLPFAWTAATFSREHYVWFALKDPRVLRGTVFWLSNGGRHYPPWNGRHVNVLGLEEVTSYFHLGLAESARMNPFNKLGFGTSVELDPRRRFTVNYLIAVAPIPVGFDRVADITPGSDGAGVNLRSASGKTVPVPLDLDFLSGGDR